MPSDDLIVTPLSVVVFGLDEVGEVNGFGLGSVGFVDVLRADIVHFVAAAALGATTERTVTRDL